MTINIFFPVPTIFQSSQRSDKKSHWSKPLHSPSLIGRRCSFRGPVKTRAYYRPPWPCCTSDVRWTLRVGAQPSHSTLILLTRLKFTTHIFIGLKLSGLAPQSPCLPHTLAAADNPLMVVSGQPHGTSGHTVITVREGSQVLLYLSYTKLKLRPLIAL